MSVVNAYWKRLLYAIETWHILDTIQLGYFNCGERNTEQFIRFLIKSLFNKLWFYFFVQVSKLVKNLRF